MKRSIFSLLFILYPCLCCHAQNLVNHKGTRIQVDTSKWMRSGSHIFNKNTGSVGIGTAGLADANAVLEIKSTDKGMLIPRVALSAKNNASPLTAHIAGMLLYNTATSGLAPNKVSPGFYYNNGTIWVRVMEESAVPGDTTNDGWKENVSNTEVRLAYRSDGTTPRTAGNAFVIKDTGQVGIGTSTPSSSLHLGGSFASSIRSISAATTLTNTDHYILMLSGSSITLPDATTCPGRVYHIRNRSGVNKTISLSGSSTTVLNNQTMTCVSDGTIWQRFGTAP